MTAIVAVTASNCGGYDDEIAHFQVVNAAPYLDDFPHEFVSDDVTGLGCGDVTAVNMEVRAANCC
jgi:hypothetical protein